MVIWTKLLFFFYNLIVIIDDEELTMLEGTSWTTWLLVTSPLLGPMKQD